MNSNPSTTNQSASAQVEEQTSDQMKDQSSPQTNTSKMHCSKRPEMWLENSRQTTSHSEPTEIESQLTTAMSACSLQRSAQLEELRQQQLPPFASGLSILSPNLSAPEVFQQHELHGARMEDAIRRWARSSKIQKKFYRYRLWVRDYQNATALAQLAYQLGHIGRNVAELFLDYSGMGTTRPTTEFNDLIGRMAWKRLETVAISNCQCYFDFELPAFRKVQRLHFTHCRFQARWNELIESNVSHLRFMQFESVSELHRAKSYPLGLQRMEVLSCYGIDHVIYRK